MRTVAPGNGAWVPASLTTVSKVVCENVNVQNKVNATINAVRILENLSETI
jgi:hypothetical protein